PYYDGATKEDIAITDSGLGLTYNAANNGLINTGYTPFHPDTGSQVNGRATMSYVTGSHALKTGLQFYRGADHRDAYVETGLSYAVRLGVPTAVTQWASPSIMDNTIFFYGLYAQDQWTVR